MHDIRLNLLLLIDSLGMGGAERMLVNLLPFLDQSTLRIRVAYLAIHDGNPLIRPIRELGITVDRIPVSRMTSPAAIPKLLYYLRKHHIELIHTQLVTAIVLGNLAAKILGLPSISTLHTLDAPPPGSRTEKRRRAMWWALRHFTDRIIAVSDQTRRHHIHAGRLPGEKVVTLYNGVDPERFDSRGKPWRKDVRRSLGIHPDDPLLTTVAVLREPKGIQHMIASMPEILQQSPSARYLIVGSGPFEDDLRAQLKSLRLEGQIIMAGQREDIPQILAAADIFVHPTLDDALPTVLAEAMAAGKPIVASAIGGVPEMVENHRNGLLVPAADEQALASACLQLIKDHDLRGSMAAISREISEAKFDIRKQSADLTRLYLELAERTPHDGRSAHRDR